VFWDVQNVLLEDVDRIEVVSGPGGTLWGANAVNGVINIVTKSAKETQGLHVSGATGSFLRDHIELRYGFQVDSTIFFRIYGQRFDQRSTTITHPKQLRSPCREICMEVFQMIRPNV
jgi:iron complex outermembrane receptor protein